MGWLAFSFPRDILHVSCSVASPELRSWGQTRSRSWKYTKSELGNCKRRGREVAIVEGSEPLVTWGIWEQVPYDVGYRGRR